MSYLLDTNVISETITSQPNKNVINWLDGINNELLYISVLTIGEIKKGVEKLPEGAKKNSIIKWLENSLPLWFGNNLLSIDIKVVEKWGYISAVAKQSLSAIDELIAATALTYNLKLVTRNEKYFKLTGLEVINPFNS